MQNWTRLPFLELIEYFNRKKEIKNVVAPCRLKLIIKSNQWCLLFLGTALLILCRQSVIAIK